MFLMYPPRPMLVLMLTPIPILYRLMCSAKTFLIPPDVSLPIAMPANGDDPVMRRIVMFELGRPKAIPYWSQPLLMATRSSPVEMYESSMQTLKLESMDKNMHTPLIKT